VSERIQIMGNGAGDSEAAAIVAAVEQFLADTAPPALDAPKPSPWARAALEEGIAARQLHGDAWGHAPRPR
jgi:hypothetical protein